MFHPPSASASRPREVAVAVCRGRNELWHLDASCEASEPGLFLRDALVLAELEASQRCGRCGTQSLFETIEELDANRDGYPPRWCAWGRNGLVSASTTTYSVLRFLDGLDDVRRVVRPPAVGGVTYAPGWATRTAVAVLVASDVAPAEHLQIFDGPDEVQFGTVLVALWAEMPGVDAEWSCGLADAVAAARTFSG